MTAPPRGSLDGVRVIEIGTSVAAPMAAQILGDLGADVIKVEPIGRGDDSRNWAPPTWGDESVTFLALNRNKRSLALDFKTDRGRVLLDALIAGADVLVHNLRPGALARAGWPATRLAELNPRLINCEMTGFGPSGPRAAQPAYDPLLQAYSGIVSITGEPGATPARVPVSLLDMGTGMWAVIGIYDALRRRERTGRGAHLEVSLLQTALTWLSTPLTSVLAGNPAPERLGSGLAGVVPYGAFATADGHVFISAGNDQLWTRLCDALDAVKLRADPRFATNRDRVRGRGDVNAAVGAATSRYSTADLLDRLTAAGVPCAPVQTLDQVAKDDQVTAIGAVSPLPHHTVPDFAVVNLPMTFDGAYPVHRLAPPSLGADTRATLTELGISTEEIAALAAEGVVQVTDEPATIHEGTP